MFFGRVFFSISWLRQLICTYDASHTRGGASYVQTTGWKSNSPPIGLELNGSGRVPRSWLRRRAGADDDEDVLEDSMEHSMLSLCR